MKYLLMLYFQEDGWSKLAEVDKGRWLAAYEAYNDALTKAGVLRDTNSLAPSATATTVRVTNDVPQVLDGPYAESREQLGGYYVIEVDDLDTALAWAARCPAASHGAIEVRPLGWRPT